MPGVALISECDIVVVGASGTRVIKAADFFVAALETALASDEIITEVKFPPWPPGRRFGFLEFARRKGDFAIAGVAVFYDLDATGQVVDAHVGVIGAAETPVRLTDVEALLNGCVLDEALITQAQALASASVTPSADIHAAADYRQSLVGTLTARVLRHTMTINGTTL
jgi:carbon-monoxide dehydrogenase medium subunit